MDYRVQMEVIKCNTEVAMETTGEARNSKTKSKMAESRFAWSDGIVVDELKLNALRSYFSEGNSVSFPERYSKAEKGWDFDILKSWGAGRVLQMSFFARTDPLSCEHTHFEMYLLAILPFDPCPRGGK